MSRFSVRDFHRVKQEDCCLKRPKTSTTAALSTFSFHQFRVDFKIITCSHLLIANKIDSYATRNKNKKIKI